jgi:hypothetical protein
MVSISITKPIARNTNPAYMTFSLPCDQETAVMQFEARHGCKPEEVEEHKGKILMLGPVPEEIDLEVGE